jgi:hypothetical protein
MKQSENINDFAKLKVAYKLADAVDALRRISNFPTEVDSDLQASRMRKIARDFLIAQEKAE